MRHPESGIRLHGVWPSPDEVLVVKTALAQDDQAVRHWREWLTRNDIDRLSFGSFRLLPLVYRNLVRCGYEGPEIPKLKGVYRQSWYRNHLLFEATAKMLDRFHTLGIETMVIKGIPLVSRVYGDMGDRWMGDADIVVPYASAGRARAELLDLGWAPISDDVLFAPEFRPSMGFAEPGGLELDLHWFLFKQRLYPEAVDPFRDRAVDFQLNGVTTRALDLTDELLLSLINGVYWEPDTSIRWIPDVILTLRAHGATVDWRRLLTTARNLHLAIVVRDAFRYLTRTFDHPIPGWVIGELEEQPPGRSERIEHWFKLHTGPQYPWGGLPFSWFQYSRQSRARGSRPSLGGFRRYLIGMWELSGQGPWEALQYRSRRHIARSIAAKRAGRRANTAEIDSQQ